MYYTKAPLKLQIRSCYTAYMKWFKKPINWNVLGVNYIGGLGYYSALLAFSLVIFFGIALLFPAALEGPAPSAQQSVETSATSPAPERSLAATILTTLLSIPIMIILLGFILALPYYIARCVHGAVRWLVDVVGLQVRSLAILTVKLALLFLGACVLLFLQYRAISPESITLPLYITMAAFGSSAGLFIVQHAVARLAHVRAESIY